MRKRRPTGRPISRGSQQNVNYREVIKDAVKRKGGILVHMGRKVRKELGKGDLTSLSELAKYKKVDPEQLRERILSSSWIENVFKWLEEI